jgi:hypothetical protein
MSDQPKLPSLPEPDMHDNGDVFGNDLVYGHTREAASAIQIAAYRAGMEQAAQIVEGHDTCDPWYIAAAIRSAASAPSDAGKMGGDKGVRDADQA